MSAKKPSDHTKIPVIAPGPATTRPAGQEPQRRSALLKASVLTVLAVLVVLAVGVFTIFPRMVAERPPSAPATVESPAVQARASGPDEQAQAQAQAEKRAAEEALGRLLRRQTELEVQQVAVWADEDYAAVGAQVEQADALFAQARFAEAETAYDTAAAALDALEASKPERLNAALASGAEALRVGDGERASEAFAIALSLAPENAEAQRGAERALDIEVVFAHLATARKHETKDELELARAEYAQALALDSEVLAAGEGLQRVTDEIETREFRRSMSDALAGIDAQNFEAARRALDEAASIRPKAIEVADAKRRLNRAYEAVQIQRRQRRAREYEQSELWEKANGEYTAVLAIDDSLPFAQRGARRTGQLAALQKEMDKFLREPNRAYDPNAVKHVQRLLDAAQALSPAGPTLAASTQRLQELLDLAKTPVTVSLASDNETHVIVYKVGELGRFTERSLTLRPGSYVAVGRRVGYRDVRVAINVVPGESRGPFVIRCQERI